MKIKSQAELRHALAHIVNAIEALASGCPLTARDELDSIKGLILFDDDDPKTSELFYKKEKTMACRGQKKRPATPKPKPAKRPKRN